jgi:hypothetical protein
MIAIVTSCIKPIEPNGLIKSFVSLEERCRQTIYTLQRIKEVGFEQIILADNSDGYDYSQLGPAIDGVKIIQFRQYQFPNKGINEILMLLSALDEIPTNIPIFKISGRYFPTENFLPRMDLSTDFKVRGGFKGKVPTISTRAYFVRNKQIYEDFLLYCLNETYSYNYRIVGFRSLFNFVMEFFRPSLRKESHIAIEFAGGRVLKKGHFTYERVERLHIKGQIAGIKGQQLIEE